ncbi:MAG: hypothetical protein OEU36_03705 [Gammaproteobacteria bacterium]|nr:hypothetical protein [Gammaproteobacteria bacterium]
MILFFVFPMTVSAMLISMYFSGIDVLQQIVSPMRREDLAVAMREFGLLENLQNFYLLAIFIMCCCAIRRKAKWERKAWVAVAALAVFVFLEEIDYGLNFYDLLKKKTLHDADQVRNIHNVGDLNKKIKIAVDLMLVSVFMIAPFVLSRSASAFIQYVLPNRWFALTVLGMALLSSLAHKLDDAGLAPNGSLENNITEFRELTIYYMWMLYIYELVFRRRYVAQVP